MARLRLSALAQADIMDVLFWTAQRYGDQARERYEQLMSAALRDLSADPLRLGTVARPELGIGRDGRPIELDVMVLNSLSLA
jgi:toxin ParE1/3/4